jgi:type II secretory pathway component PulL
VPAILWLQGESDAGVAGYESAFEQLVLDLQRDVAAASGQAEPVRILVCTPFPRDIAAAQRAVAARVPGVAIACDTATFPKSDGIHLTAAGSRAAGAALGALLR